MTGRKAYHRGNLREDLMAAARVVLERDGVSAISIRKLAADLGVSHNAPYMHFKTKDDVLTALANIGFAELVSSIRATVSSAPDDWDAQFIAGCRGYVRFATSSPRLYALMFQDRDLSQPDGATQAGLDAFNFLSRFLAEGQKRGCVHAGDPNRIAIFAWSTLHGVSVLSGSQGNPPSLFGEAPDETETAVFEALLRGVRSTR